MLPIVHVLIHYTEYSPTDVDSLLRGLEHLALAGTPGRLPAQAAYTLAYPGSRKQTKPLAGTFARLERIYLQSPDALVRSMVVSAMDDLAERAAALAFLERVAAEDVDMAGGAVASLLTMDEDGRAVLRRLHDSGAVRNPDVRADLETLAQRGYRL